MAARLVARFAGILPKAGNAPDECEDAFCAAGTQFAIADGASEGSYSQVWAGMLVRSFCEADAAAWQGGEFASWIEQCQREWSQWQQDLVQKDLPWFTREKLRHGSFATFLGVVLAEREWHAFACGDSCLLAVRDDRFIGSFPIAQSEHFDNMPALVASSRPTLTDRLRLGAGDAQTGDRIYLASDALAHWFLSTAENGDRPWTILDAIDSDEAFALLVSDERQQGRLRNDDVTMVALEVAGA